jgi:hypothetical protein
MINKKRVAKSIRNVSISVIVLLVLLVGAGAAYTWFMGRTPAVPLPVETVEDTAKPAIKHVEQAANVQVGVSVQSLTSPVAPGDNASIIIKTNPGAWCTIAVEYDKVASTDSGLKGKTADEFGVVTWAWTVEKTATVGKWPVTVTCTRNKLWAVVVGDSVVAQQ